MIRPPVRPCKNISSCSVIRFWFDIHDSRVHIAVGNISDDLAEVAVNTDIQMMIENHSLIPDTRWAAFNIRSIDFFASAVDFLEVAA